MNNNKILDGIQLGFAEDTTGVKKWMVTFIRIENNVIIHAKMIYIMAHDKDEANRMMMSLMASDGICVGEGSYVLLHEVEGISTISMKDFLNPIVQ